MFYDLVKRVSIDICEFLALGMGILFLCMKMIPFVNAAIKLNYINGQLISYLLYSILLTLIPVVLLFVFQRANKGSVLRYLFYAHALVIIAGTVSDIIVYNWFTDYTFKEGDAVFVNLMWNMPNLFGVFMSAVVAALYFVLGKQIKRKRRVSYWLYVSIFIVSHAPTFIYTYFSSGTLPRDTYLQKSLYVIAIHLLILAALTIASTTRSLWRQHVWN